MKCFLLCFALISQCAYAQYMTGNKLSDSLKGNDVQKAYAYGYILGVTDGGDTIAWCTPKAATTGQLADIIRQYLEQNPSTRHLPADLLVHDALKKTYPCPKQP